jgi:hypothetical protein
MTKPKEKKPPFVELKQGLRIGVGAGCLILDCKTVDHDGLERWKINYHLRKDGPVRDHFWASVTIIREMLKVEKLEKKSESQRKSLDYWKDQAAKAENQLAEMERKADAVFKTNKTRIQMLEGSNKDLLISIDSYKGANDSLKTQLDRAREGQSTVNRKLAIQEQLTKTAQSDLSVLKIFTWGGWLLFFAVCLISLWNAFSS